MVDSLQIATGLVSIDTHPAVVAWHAIDPAARPIRVDVLKRDQLTRKKGKSNVYRLVLPGMRRGIVAKRALTPIARVERTIYEEILSKLPLTAVGFHGFLEEDEGEYGWIFVDDSGGREISWSVAEERRLATEWIAILHRSAVPLGPPAALPRRDLGHYRAHLHMGADLIRASLSKPALTADSGHILKNVFRTCTTLDARWHELESRCRNALPATLVHADVKARNLHLRSTPAGPQVIVIDWEEAGWGIAAVDLTNVDPETYVRINAGAWPTVTPADVREMAVVGGILRTLAAIHWDATRLQYDWMERALRNMEIFVADLDAALVKL